jgi:triphosphoribosyl-dephospho-CoA synthase
MTPRDAFLRACALDIAVRKPGNVSLASPGHGMHAAQFDAAALAAAGPLFAPGAAVGTRIEAAVAASLAAAGCNANLGIVLLAAPIAAAAEDAGTHAHPGTLRQALRGVLDRLDEHDAAGAFRAIALANPGGLGHVPSQDVRSPPQVSLREAMALAAGRDSIARQYANGFADLFDTGLPLVRRAITPATVLQVYLAFLSRWPDSHIVRKHGEAPAHSVMSAAQGFAARADPGAEPALAAWDESLKARGLNPGTSADLTVSTLMLALLWHGS